MKRLFMTVYRYRDGNDEDDLRHLTKKFVEFGTGVKPIAHFERLDGRGGFMVEELDEESAAKSYEALIRYGPYMEFEVIPVTSMEEAFPIIASVYG